MELDNLVEFSPSMEMQVKLHAYGIPKTFKEGDVILNESSHINSIPIVKSGSLRVIRSDDDGREILLYYIKAGESCIMSFLGGIHNDTSKVKAVAEDDTEILFIPIEKVSLLIKEYPEWLDYCEDLLFDFAIRAQCGGFSFAPNAIVYFRPRGSLRSFYKQYYLYVCIF